jgi:transposase
MSDVQIDQVKLYGPILVLNHLSQEIGLVDHLGKYGPEILSMVYAHCLDYESINQMSAWFERTDLNVLLNLEGVTEERLLKALDALQSQDPEQLQKTIFESVGKKYNINDTGIIYDVTNTYLYGKKCPLGKEGHDKDGVRGRPLIQIGLAVTRQAGIPVFIRPLMAIFMTPRLFKM